jgi:hypothetical protein
MWHISFSSPSKNWREPMHINEKTLSSKDLICVLLGFGKRWWGEENGSSDRGSRDCGRVMIHERQ